MFLDFYVSDLGKATSLHLGALRKQLGKGCDPCFDYSRLSEAEPRAAAAQESESDEEDGGMAKFRRLLREANAGKVEAEEVPLFNFNEEPEPSVMTVRKLREDKRPSSAFRNRSRKDLQKLDIENKYRAPPVGRYDPKEDCLAAFGKMKHPLEKVTNFGLREKTLNRKVPESEQEPSLDTVECSQVQKKMVVYVDMKNQRPRPAFVNKECNDSEACDPDGVINGHLNCAKYGKFYRQPCFDFSKSSGPRGKTVDSSGEPGKYDPVKPKLASSCLEFEKRPGRKPMNESSRCTDHLPDRSLARDCPTLTRFGKVISPPVRVPDLGKYTDRPPLCSPTQEDHESSREETEVNGPLPPPPEKPQLRRPRSAQDFNLSLTRRQELQAQRQFGQDLCLSLVKENEERQGPLSIEMLDSDVRDKPSLQRRIQSFDFELLPGRDGRPMKPAYDPSARSKDQSSARRFQRSSRPGEARPWSAGRPRSAAASASNRPRSASAVSLSASNRPRPASALR